MTPLFIIALCVPVLLKLHSLSDPLDADAGSHFYFAQNQGRTPGLLPTVMRGKPPGMYLINWVLHRMAPGDAGFRWMLIMVHLLIQVLIYLIARATLPELTAIVAAGIYGLLTAIPETRCTFSHAETWVTLFITLAVFAPHPLAGVCLCAAIACKQSSILFVPILWSGSFLEGIPQLFLFLVAGGVLWNMKVRMPWGYIAKHWKCDPRVDIKMIMAQFRVVWPQILPVVILAGYALYHNPHPWFLLAVGIAVIQRHYAVHHFLPALPPLAILAATTVTLHWNWTVGVLLCLFVLAIVYRTVVFHLSDRRAKMQGLWGMFGVFMVVGKEIGLYLKANTLETDRVLQVGDQTSIYYYAERHSPWHKMHWIYPGPGPDLNKDLAACINHGNPKYIVFMSPLTKRYTDMKALSALLDMKYELAKVFHDSFPVYRRVEA